MTNEKKPKPMPNIHFRCMTWMYKFADAARMTNPRRRLEKTPIRRGMAVVDYACGPGRYAIPAAKLVGGEGKVFAVDIQPLAIKMVRKKATGQSLTNIEPILVEAYDTGIQGSSIDLVLMFDALHMISDRAALLSEVHRLLKQDGIFFLDSGHMKLSKAKEIVEDNGLFAIVECRGDDMLLAPKV